MSRIVGKGKELLHSASSLVGRASLLLTCCTAPVAAENAPPLDAEVVGEAFRTFQETLKLPQGRILSKANTLVFELDAYPGLVFKANRNKSQERYKPAANRQASLEEARRLVQEHQLTNLHVPNSQLIYVIDDEGQSWPVVVEEKLPVPLSATEVEDQYWRYQHDPQLAKVVADFTFLINRMQLNDIAFRNIPLFLDDVGNLKLALIDLEDRDSREQGFLGDGQDAPGLLRCVPHHLAQQLAAGLTGLDPTALDQALKESQAMQRAREEFAVSEEDKAKPIAAPEAGLVSLVNTLNDRITHPSDQPAWNHRQAVVWRRGNEKALTRLEELGKIRILEETKRRTLVVCL